MGLQDALPNGPIRAHLEDTDKSLDEITIADLKDQFGEQILARGLSYMHSLEDADENYRESAKGQYSDGLQRSGVEMDEETEDMADSAWTEGMVEKGIGLEED